MNIRGGDVSEKWVTTEYQQTFETIAARIEQSRQETLRTVNRALVELYWFIGQVITERQERAGWGDAVVEQLSRDLRMRFPDMQGCQCKTCGGCDSFTSPTGTNQICHHW